MDLSLKTYILLLIGAVFFAYFSSLGNPFIWDDEQFITSNQYVQQFDIQKIFTTSTTTGAGIVSNYYRPLTSLSFALDYKIWGPNPFWFHLVNLVLHTGAGIMLFLLLLALGVGEWGSFFIALFFLIHPVQTEAVTYINSRGDSLFALCLFSALFFFTKSLQEKKKYFSIIALGLYGLSIFSKETAIAAFPLFFVALALFWMKKKKIFWRFLPFFVAVGSAILVGLYILLRVTVLNFNNTLNYYNGQGFYATHLFVRLFTFARVVWIYIGILLWPYSLHMERSVSLVTSFFSPEVIGALFLFGLLIALSVWELRKTHTANIFLGLCISIFLLLPVSGVIPINGILYEHWLYVPMVGFFLIIYGLGSFLFAEFFATKQKLLISFCIVLGILYIVLTIMQNNIWANSVRFYQYTLQFAPDSARLHNNLGMSLADAGDAKAAIMQYKKSLSLDSGYPQIYNNLGNTQISVGDYVDAEKNLKKALSLAPGFGVAKNNLIRLYLVTKQYDKARSESNNNVQVENIIQQLLRQ